LAENKLEGVSERDLQVAEGKVKGVGVPTDFSTEVDGKKGAGARFEGNNVGDGAAEGGDEGLGDPLEVTDVGDEGKEVATYELLLGIPEAIRSLIDQAKLVRM
jgi:hypothetical protein